MKKIILLAIVVIFCICGGFFEWYLQNQPEGTSKQEIIKWCYGIYQETKPSLETKANRILVQNSPIYKDVETSKSFKNGKRIAPLTTANQRTWCYDQTYMMLAEVQTWKGNLNNSVPYCFGYLEKARESSYIPVFCKRVCQKRNDTDCQSRCNADFEENLRKVPRLQGQKDAQYQVKPSQFVHCIEVLKNIIQ